VNTFGECKWSALASQLPERVAKQCKRRYKKLQKKEEDSKRKAPAEETEETTAEIDMFSAGIAQANIIANNFETINTATTKKKRGNWSVEEDQKILNHVKDVEEIGNDVDWVLLASTLLGRNEKQCERRYNNLTLKNKNNCMKKGGWTVEEDCKIMEFVNTFGECKWPALASQLPERVAKQCKRRYKKLQKKEEDSKRKAPAEETEKTARDTDTVTSGIVKMVKTDAKASNTSHCKKKGNWSLEEDQKILNHVKDTEKTGEDVDWFLVASYLLGRDKDQCKRRYNKLMFKNKKKEMKKGNWTAQEDHEIMKHVKEFGDNKWHIVASRLPGRFPKQCMNRHKKLQQLKENKM